ncbi:hypothetical protein G6F43_002576 [Rhizopus delemar]|nr:hypothetical protein G6F43_002576 [Rhizopus delemar]
MKSQNLPAALYFSEDDSISRQHSFQCYSLSYPQKFRGKKVEIRETVKNQKFFADRTIDNWTFVEFLIYKEQSALKRMKTMLQEYKNSIGSLISKHKKQVDPDLLGYLTELKNKSFTDEELMKGNKENISIVDSTISNSNIIVGSGSGSITITQTKGKRKQGQNQDNDSDIVTIKRKKDSFALLRPITPSISYRFNTSGFNEQMKTRVNSIAYIKLDDKDISTSINNYPIAKSFLNDALNQQIEDLLSWMGQHGFDNTNSEDTKKAMIMTRLTLTDFYVNCLKPSPTNSLNERTPFMEYAVPIFNDKLTMLSTSVVSREKWGYTLVREVIVPRTRSARARWLKVMDLIFCTKVEFVLIAMFEEQKEVAAILESEHNDWTQVAQGTSIKYLSKL